MNRGNSGGKPRPPRGQVTHKVTQEIDVHENPYRDTKGRPHTFLHCQWVDSSGTHHTGQLDVQNILESSGLGADPGDKLIVTIEVVKQSRE